jgi:hypothetical protein
VKKLPVWKRYFTKKMEAAPQLFEPPAAASPALPPIRRREIERNARWGKGHSAAKRTFPLAGFCAPPAWMLALLLSPWEAAMCKIDAAMAICADANGREKGTTDDLT